MSPSVIAALVEDPLAWAAASPVPLEPPDPNDQPSLLLVDLVSERAAAAVRETLAAGGVVGVVDPQRLPAPVWDEWRGWAARQGRLVGFLLDAQRPRTAVVRELGCDPRVGEVVLWDVAGGDADLAATLFDAPPSTARALPAHQRSPLLLRWADGRLGLVRPAAEPERLDLYGLGRAGTIDAPQPTGTADDELTAARTAVCRALLEAAAEQWSPSASTIDTGVGSTVSLPAPPPARAIAPVVGPVRLGIIGFGHGHQPAYAQALLNQPAVVPAFVASMPTVPDRPPDVAAQWAARLGVPYYLDYRVALDQTPADLVSIAAPPQVNPQVVCECAARGLHILSEKPLAESLEAVATIAAAVRRAGVWLTLSLSSALHPAPLRRWLQQVTAWPADQLSLFHGRFLQPKSPRFAPTMAEAEALLARGARGYGEWRNFGPYLLAVAHEVLRRPPVCVQAQLAAPFVAAHQRLGLDDLAAVLVDYDGVPASLLTGRVPAPSQPATDYLFELSGAAGHSRLEHALDDSVRVWGPITDGEPYERGGLSKVRYGQTATDAFAADLIEALTTARQPALGLLTVLEIAILSEAAELSQQSGKAVRIRLPAEFSTQFSTVPSS